jgi:hypothetical protein
MANGVPNIAAIAQVGTSLNGWIDEYRISKGIARWSGASFSVPTAAYNIVGRITESVTATDTMTAVTSGRITADVSIPAITAEGEFGKAGPVYNIDVEIPAIEAEGTILHGNAFNADVTIGAIQAEGEIRSGQVIEGNAVIPAIQAVGRINAEDFVANITIPAVRASATISNTSGINANVTIAPIRASASISIKGEINANVTLAPVQAFASIAHGSILDINVTIPAILAEGTLLYGQVLNASVTIPAITAEGTFQQEPGILNASVILAPIQAHATIVTTRQFTMQEYDYLVSDANEFLLGEGGARLIVDGTGRTVVYPASMYAAAINSRNSGVTEYGLSFTFNAFCLHKGKYYGSKASGIYLLEGQSDDGTSIGIHIRKEGMDFGSSQLKRATDAYLKLRSEGNYIFTIIADGVETQLTVTDTANGQHTRKINLPRGLKGRELGFALMSSNGTKIDLDELEMLADILSRKRRS